MQKPDAWYVRAYILQIAKNRTSDELVWCPDTELECPVANKIAPLMDLKEPFLSRILTGECDTRGQRPWRANSAIFDALAKFARLDSANPRADAQANCWRCAPRAPFKPRKSRAAHMKGDFS